MAKKSTAALGKAVGKMKAARELATGHPGVFRKLGEEHTVVAMMMARIAATKNPAIRAELFPTLRRELLAHAEGEEAEFYPLLEQHDETRFLAQKARNQHFAVKKLLQDLSEMPYDAEKWPRLFEFLLENVRLHVKLEEHEIFPKAQHFIDARRARSVEEKYAQKKSQVMQAVPAE